MRIGLGFQHGEQPALDLYPEDLLLAVLMGAVGQGVLLEDGQPRKALDDLASLHGGTIVVMDGPRQTAFEKRLAEAMTETLGGLGQIPLQVRDQS